MSRPGALAAGSLAVAGITVVASRLLRRRSRQDACAPIGPAEPHELGRAAAVPLWLKLGYGLATPLIAGVYWRAYGRTNFLWLSDLALASTALAVISESRLLASMPAVGVMPLEVAWNIDFLSGGKAIGLAGYMFDARLPLGLRALSLFHVALPPTLVWMLSRLGYDRRALLYETALTWTVLPLTYALTEPEKNINWVFGPGQKPQRTLPPLLYLGLEMAVLPALVFLPMHLLLELGFGASQDKAQRGAAAECPSNSIR